MRYGIFITSTCRSMPTVDSALITIVGLEVAGNQLRSSSCRPAIAACMRNSSNASRALT